MLNLPGIAWNTLIQVVDDEAEPGVELLTAPITSEKMWPVVDGHGRACDMILRASGRVGRIRWLFTTKHQIWHEHKTESYEPKTSVALRIQDGL